MANSKKTSQDIASKAAKVLANSNASDIQKKLAGSALSQRSTTHQTGSEMEDIASRVLRSSKYSEETKELAASVLSQSNKDR
ncbi:MULTISPECIES: hypothetical protein [Serratia]|uniref:hypothetical protein n=1 Tax=Serratia TaxID=613 RepID=UPI000EF20AE2|nr:MULTISPECIES: hypothetical protein [Serratia]MDX7490951.1 hypothetical protein [Serratia marcescens]RLO37620.1 hypothetical protein CLM69_09590 [Serratia marcescens]RLO43871.1 hypothetical protein CLM68_12925 [Serratia marcescens]UJE00885.1 hypothetical protein FS592_20795 [Serratia plymuthica]HAU4288240.1 hypothetical protein [Serratia marcescens]